ncbi:hypothetical protein ABFX02_13G161300 [Erythranthe guttata]
MILLLVVKNKWSFLAACLAPFLSLIGFILSIKSYLDRGFEMGLFSGGTYFSLIGWHKPTIKEKLAIFYSSVHMISAVIDFARVVLGYGSHSAFPIAVAYLAIFCSISDLTVEVLDHRVS